MAQLLVIDGHPNRASFIAALAEAYARAAEQEGVEVRRLVLSELQFDLVLRESFRSEQALEPDLLDAREAILAAQHVAWFFPMWWLSLPAHVKGFVDRMFTPGFAFRYRGRLQPPAKLLTGRSARVVMSMDSPAPYYTLVRRGALHASFSAGTLGFVGFAPVRTTTLHEVRFMTESTRAKALRKIEDAARSDLGGRSSPLGRAPLVRSLQPTALTSEAAAQAGAQPSRLAKQKTKLAGLSRGALGMAD